GNTADGRKVRGTIHWVNARDCADCEIRLYDSLFLAADPDSQEDFVSLLNPASLEILSGCKCERALAGAKPGEAFQFLRSGYFTADTALSKPGSPVWGRSVALKDGYKP
ncbi:MAG: glutamine--tRNA ligase, partial [Oscillospiraceae bacterium]|nr:glutamine--tRNA ligase [Oscillospiraceae bacterium]